MRKRRVNLRRLHNMPDEKRLTRDEVANIMGCSASTIAAHNYAGVLDYCPTRPISMTVADVKSYAHDILNGSRERLHLTMRIKAADCPPYSRIDGVRSLADRPQERIARVIQVTDELQLRYKKEARRG